jgi:hypothetical protein
MQFLNLNQNPLPTALQMDTFLTVTGQSDQGTNYTSNEIGYTITVEGDVAVIARGSAKRGAVVVGGRVMKKLESGIVALLVAALAGWSPTVAVAAPAVDRRRVRRRTSSILRARRATPTLTLSLSRASIDANNADRVTVVARLLDPFGDPLAGVCRSPSRRRSPT